MIVLLIIALALLACSVIVRWAASRSATHQEIKDFQRGKLSSARTAAAHTAKAHDQDGGIRARRAIREARAAQQARKWGR